MDTYKAIDKASNGRNHIGMYYKYNASFLILTIIQSAYMHGCASNALTVREYAYRQAHTRAIA